MRTDDPRPRSARSEPFRDGARRAWRWLRDRGPRARLWTAGAALAALIGVGYYAAVVPSESTETTWLFEGAALAPDDARHILSALAVAKIPASTAGRGQIAVPAARKADALALLTKQKLGPKTLREIQEEASRTSMFDFPVDRVDQRNRLRELEAESIIAGFEGIASADVRIHGSTSRPGSRGAKIVALVRVETQGNRPLSPQTLQAIRAVLKNAEPDLPDDALDVLDRSGRPYVAAGNPEASAAMMAHVREEELRGKILQDLGWIDGVRVLVSLESPPPADAEVAPSAAPAVVVNGPADAEVASPPPAPKPPALAKARILVQVPITHYLRGYQATHRREATLEELRPYVAKVEELIRATVQNGIPAGELASLRIDRIDAAGPVLPSVGASESATTRLAGWIAPAAGGAVVALVVLVLIGTRWMAARRPPPVAASVPRAHFEVTDDAGPSGRVRDLVRRDPAAAAGVLGRWIGQGGPGA